MWEIVYSLVRDAVGAIGGWRSRRSLSPESVFEARERWRSKFEDEVHRGHRHGGRDCYIVNAGRLNEYQTSGVDWLSRLLRRPSAWFRAGFSQAHADSFLCGLGVAYVKKVGDRWQETLDHEYSDARKLFVIGYIPYEWIMHVDWNGDEYTNKPVIYCRFWGKKGSPFRSVSYCRTGQIDDHPEFYVDVASLEEVRRPTRRETRAHYEGLRKKWEQQDGNG